MNIVVLTGGLSPEREISLASGALIANALMDAGHKVLLLDVYEGIKLVKSSYEQMFIVKEDGVRFEHEMPKTMPDLTEVISRNHFQKTPIGENVIELCKYAGVVFLALRGDIGENGKLQATFDNHNIKYTGSGYLGSALAMDKDIAKKLFTFAGISTPTWFLYKPGEENMDDVWDKIKLPCVVKPSACGSSVGVAVAANKYELLEATRAAGRYTSSIIIEEYIRGREFSVGVLNEEALPVIEIICSSHFYDHQSKFQPERLVKVCPAELSASQKEEVQNLALRVHKLLRLEGYSRMDFILDAKGRFYSLEANSLPGMLPGSLLPQEARAAGIKYESLCEKIALLPFSRRIK